MNYIKEELNVIKHDNIKRRLQREFEPLINLQIIYPESVKIDIGYDKSPYNIENYSVGFMTILDNKYYKFLINHNYPFSPPKLEINFRPYQYYLNIKSIDFQTNLLKHKKIRCFCCENKLCGINWSPAYTLSRVIEEVELFKNISRDIIYIVIIDVIKRKYLIDDINISQWLFT
jgi:ubiquitin-protein ligase